MLVRRRQEEHVHALNERAVGIGNRLVDPGFLQTIRQAACVEAVLEFPVPPMVERGHIAP